MSAVARRHDLDGHLPNDFVEMTVPKPRSFRCPATWERTELRDRLAEARRQLGARINAEAVWLGIERELINSAKYEGMATGLLGLDRPS